MKAIINGKRYDTEKAEQVAGGGSDGNTSRSDFRWYEEALYRTPRGKWFLAGSGGAMSAYSRPYGQNGSQGGSAIKPLTEAQARDWLESERKVDAIEKWFAASIEDA